jgi:hypothetical protein
MRMSWIVQTGRDTGRKFNGIDCTAKNGKLHITFPYQPLLVDTVKLLSGAKWDKENREWTADINEHNIMVIKELTGDFTIRKHYRQKFDDVPIKVPAYIPAIPAQIRIAQFILKRKRVIVAGEMGVGKTLATLLALMQMDFTTKIIIVAPLNACVQWKREIYKWNFNHPYVTIVNYESLKKHTHRLTDFDVLILDESVKIKTPTAERSKLVAEFCRSARLRDKYIVCLSGAPAPKNPGDWWHQCEVLQPGFLFEGSRQKLEYTLGTWDFTGQYPVRTDWDEAKIAEFTNVRLQDICYVVRKADVLDLPPKIFDRIEITPPKDYIEAARYLVEHFQGKPLTLLAKLRELSDGFFIDAEGNLVSDSSKLSPKEEALKELLEFYNDEDNPCPRIVIYAAFRESIERIVKLCDSLGWRVGKAYGNHPISRDFMDDFDSDNPMPHATVAYPGCVHGLAFQRSPALLYYSNTFNADDRLQSLERVDRHGKDLSKPTRVVDLMHLPSDQKVLDLVEKKIHVQNVTLDEIKRWYKLGP